MGQLLQGTAATADLALPGLQELHVNRQLDLGEERLLRETAVERRGERREERNHILPIGWHLHGQREERQEKGTSCQMTQCQ